MTHFERDLNEVRNGYSVEVLKRRKAEIERLTNEGKACKNSFRRLCIAQEVARLTEEYRKLDSEVYLSNLKPSPSGGRWHAKRDG